MVASLGCLQRELRKPEGIFDPHTALAALETLAGASRDHNDPAAKRYNAIYKQCRPFVDHDQFQAILLKLVGAKEDIQIAKVIEKTL